MPTYGYRCSTCGHEFERIQKMTDPALTECESCNGPVKKILYPVGIQFVGSGFYVNDYARSGGSSKSNGASESAAAKSESKSEAASSDTSSSTSTAAPASAPAAPAASSSSSDSK